MYTLAAIALCICGLLGAWLIWYGWQDRRDPTRPRKTRTKMELPRTVQMRAAAGLLIGILGWIVSGWFLCVLFGPALGVLIPTLFARRAADREIARLEALEEWLRNLVGVLNVGSNIEQAIINTRKTIPAELESEIGALITRLSTNIPTRIALRQFSDDMNDYTADLICSALIIASQLRSSGLPRALQGFAETVADDVKDRRAVEVERQGPRTQARIVTIIVVGFLIYLFTLTDYMEPYKTPAMQLVLAGILMGFAGLLLYMRHLTRPIKPARFLNSATTNNITAAQSTEAAPR
jgi:tight adherence protein B